MLGGSADANLLERNKQLEAQVEQLEARVEQLERDLSIEKLQSAQQNAEALRRRVMTATRALAAVLMLPNVILFYYFAAPGIAGTFDYAIPGWPFFICAVPLGQSVLYSSILPNDEKLARVFALGPSIFGAIIPLAGIFVGCVRVGQWLLSTVFSAFAARQQRRLSALRAHSCWQHARDLAVLRRPAMRRRGAR